MHELATRIDLVAHACDGKLNLSPPYAREYAYLQFRRICELIALGCLQLHGDLPLANKESTRGEWNADKIMLLLQKEHQHAFPQSVIRSKSPYGKHMIDANSKPNALTHKDFKKLYHECGEVLHRGTIKKLEKETSLEKEDYEKVMSWQTKIVDLMNEHLIGRANQKSFYVISLRTESGFPECRVFNITSDSTTDVAVYRLNA